MISIPGLFQGLWRRPRRLRNKFGLHSEWNVYLYDEFGRLEYECHPHNFWHDTGDQYALGVLFNNVDTEVNSWIGLDSRSTLEQSHTAAQVATYEEDSSTYERQSVDVEDSKYTIAYSSARERYEATSVSVDFAAGAQTDWQSNRNAFLVAADDTLKGLDANAILLASVAFDDPIVVATTKTLSLTFALALREAA